MMLCASCQLGSRTIEGNGKVITRNIEITDYTKLAIAGSMDVEYEESSAAPFLSVSLDENLFEYLKAEVDGSTLKIGPKNYGLDGLNIRATVFKVKTTSRKLEELGCAGSGNVNARNVSAASSFDVNLSGSGNVSVRQISVNSLECNLAGSGDILITGSTAKAEYNLAGSGDIKAADCRAEKAEANIAGSGNIELHASSTLEASIVGSGDVSYKGTPQVKVNKIGSGKVRSL